MAVGVLTGGTSLVWQGAAIGFTAGATGTLVNGGSIGQALRNGMIGGLFGAVSAGFTYGIGSAFGGNLGAKALAHGALNSFMTRARGGRWNSGFWAGFAGTMLSPITGMARGYYAKIAASAFVAGTISQITGGKFANGAWSGAFRFMFNENALSLTKKFFSGISGEYVFGPKDEITQDLMNDPRLRRGIQLWKNTHSLDVGNKGFIDTGLFFPIEFSEKPIQKW